MTLLAFDVLVPRCNCRSHFDRRQSQIFCRNGEKCKYAGLGCEQSIATSAWPSFAFALQALITIKSAETIAGLRQLSDNLLRALIVSCNEGMLRPKAINPNTANIGERRASYTCFAMITSIHSPAVLSLSHSYAGLTKILTSSADHAKDAIEMPRVTVHLEGE